MKTVLLLLVLLGSPGWAWGDAARWDDQALRHAGREAFICRAERAFPRDMFTDPVMVVPYERGGVRQLLVLGRLGKIWSCPLDRQVGAAHLVYDLAEHLAGESKNAKAIGLTAMGALFDREFPDTPNLFLRFSVRKPRPINQLVRFRVLESTPLRLGAMEEILSWESNGHDGGDLGWGPRDGYLYLSAGDGSAPGDPDNIGQETARIRGSILRLDVHATGGLPYRVPPDNPFVGLPDVRPELWCYGLRNPWRMTFHPENGELWLGDNGDEHWELVHKIERGANYGWSAFEGSHPFRASNPLAGPNPTHTPPMVEHPHTEMRSVIGGVFYRGRDIPRLRGHYLYGCYFTKQLWAFSYQGGVVGNPFLVGELPGPPVDFAEDHEGEILVSCLEEGIFRLRPVPEVVAARSWPARLSATGLFADTAAQRPAPGVVSYQTNAQAWFDGATSERFVAVPKGKAMKQSGGRRLVKSWDMSEGTALAQTLSLEGKRVETQVLYFDGQWQGHSYRWNDEGTDAALVDAGGLTTEVALPDGSRRPWRFQARAECMTCHTQRSNFAISLTTAQLDRARPGGSNQLDRLLRAGYLQNSPDLRRLRGKPRPDPYDSSLPLDLRARSYLDLNCAHCHRETGLGGRAGFQLMSHLPLGETGIVNVRATLGTALGPEAVLVVPGKPDQSELLARMARRGPGQMPLIGSHRVDEAGVALIREWILSLKQND